MLTGRQVLGAAQKLFQQWRTSGEATPACLMPDQNFYFKGLMPVNVCICLDIASENVQGSLQMYGV